VKVLVGTTQTQGMRPGDFCFAEGQLLTMGTVCGKDRDDPDGGCGCGRSFTGLDTHQGTTTAIVEDRDMTRQEFEGFYLARMRAAWGSAVKADAMLELIVQDLLQMVDGFTVGTVVERRLDLVRERLDEQGLRKFVTLSRRRQTKLWDKQLFLEEWSQEEDISKDDARLCKEGLAWLDGEVPEELEYYDSLRVDAVGRGIKLPKWYGDKPDDPELRRLRRESG
jgi:hypothetical protein